MTVSATNATSGPFIGNGGATIFPFGFSAGGLSEVQVLVNSAVQTSGYVVSLNPNQSATPGGSVTFTAPPAVGAKVLIASNPSFTQETSFLDAGQFLASSHDDALDDAARRDIYLKDAASRSVRAPLGEALPPLAKASDRAGKFLTFDADGNPIVTSSGTGADTALRTDLSGSSGAGLIGATGGGSVQAKLDKFGDQTFGTLPSGGYIPLSLVKSFTAAIDGSTDFRAMLIQAQLQGANGATQVNAQNIQVELGHPVGKTVTVTHGNESYIRLGLQKSAVGNVTSARVFEGHVANESLGATIASAFVFYANDTDYGDDIVGAAGTITTNAGVGVGNIGHATKNTNAYQFYAANCTTSPGITASYYTEMAGGGKWAFYGAGNSPSALLGALSLGKVTAPTEVLDIHGSATVDGFYKVVGLQVVGPRRTGWAAATGTATRSTFATGSVTLPQLAEHVKALIDDLISHGLIGT
jgi:hypothetical protein